MHHVTGIQSHAWDLLNVSEDTFWQGNAQLGLVKEENGPSGLKYILIFLNYFCII